MSLKEVKSKIRAVKKIAQVTKAMEAVSAVKMRRSQTLALAGRPYALHAMGILSRLVEGEGLAMHALVRERPEVKRVCLVVVSSDRGLAGALNANVLRRAHALIRENGWSKESLTLITIGKKCRDHFARRGFAITQSFERWGEGIAIGDPDILMRSLIAQFKEGAFDECWLVYTNFLSTFKQEPIALRFLPFSPKLFTEVVEAIVPERGKFSELRTLRDIAAPREYMFEPSPAAVLEELLPRLAAVELYHAVLESNASEHSARMVAMKTASDRARDLTRSLTLAYNKERQSSITAEIGEITTGIEAMR